MTGGGVRGHPATAATATITRTLDELTDVPLYGLFPEAVQGNLLTSVVTLAAPAGRAADVAHRRSRDGRHCGKGRGTAAGRAVRLAKALAAEHECTAERCPTDGRARNRPA